MGCGCESQEKYIQHLGEIESLTRDAEVVAAEGDQAQARDGQRLCNCTFFRELGHTNVVIDYLDPTGELIQHRFFSNHASVVELIKDKEFHIKDLRILEGLDLKDVLIVDN